MILFNGRLQLIPFWKLVRLGLFSANPLRYIGRGLDEYHNKSVFVVLPLIGQVVLFTGKDLNEDRVHLHSASGDLLDGYIDPDCEACSDILGSFLIHSYAASQPEGAGLEDAS